MNKQLAIIFLILNNYIISSPQTIYLFSHGLANYGSRQAHAYMKQYTHPITGSICSNDLFLMDGIVVSFNYPDALYIPPFVNPFYTNLGQKDDVITLQEQYEKVITEYPDANIVLFGMSRGATTIINFLAIYKPKRISAVILESPYDSGISIIKAVEKQLGITISKDYGQTILEYIFKKYNRNGLQAINLVEAISHDIPILFICSKQDQRVPYQSTHALYYKLKKTGHKHCYLFTASYGKHFDILWNKDGFLYQHIVHSFYKKYNLLYEKDLAKHADLLLSWCKK